jgi:hypothetical protein
LKELKKLGSFKPVAFVPRYIGSAQTLLKRKGMVIIMRLFLSELRKLLGNAKTLFLIGTAVLINLVFLIIPEFNEFTPASYNLIWDKLGELEPSARANFIAERIADYDDDRWFTDGGETEFASDFFEEQELLRYVQKEISQADSYPDYLKNVDASAENMKVMSFFSDKNSFNYRNIIKTQKEFSALDPKNVVSDKSKGVLMPTKFGVSDILMILLTLFFAVKLLISEREKGYMPLIRATANGRGKLGGAKLFALVISEISAALLLYGSGIAAGATLYGFGDLSRGIQSVYGFFSCGATISVGLFLAKFMLIKLLFCVTFAAAVFLFSALPLESAAEFVLILGFTACETFLYYLIPSTSVFAPLRQINLTAAADSTELAGKYLNVNFFGFPVKGALLTCCASAVFAIICGAVGIRTFSGRMSQKRRSVKNGLLHGASTSLFAQELYKSFIGGKAICILSAAVIFAISLQKPVKPYYGSLSDYLYYSYVSEIQGEYTEEKSQYIQSELESAYLDFSEQGFMKVEALTKLSQHAEYLKENGGFFLNDMGYRMLTGSDSVRIYDRLAAAVKAFVLILIAAYSYTSEHRFGAIMLLHSSVNGKVRTFFLKLLTMTICSFLILAIFDGLRIYNILNAWGAELFTAPALSMEHLSGVSMPTILYVILTEAGRLAGMTLTAAAVFFISSRVGNYSSAVIFSAVLLVVPLVLSVIGFGFMDYFLFNSLLIGNLIG